MLNGVASVVEVLNGPGEDDPVKALVREDIEGLVHIGLINGNAFADTFENFGGVIVHSDTLHLFFPNQHLKQRATTTSKVEHFVALLDATGNDHLVRTPFGLFFTLVSHRFSGTKGT